MISRSMLRAFRPRLILLLLVPALVAAVLAGVRPAPAEALALADVGATAVVHQPGVPDVLKPQQIALAAQKAGFTGQNLVTAVAVAMAESSGDANVVNSIHAYGLWQILASAHPDLISRGEPDASRWYDPYVNAGFAWELSNHGTDWQPWQAYTTGAYQKYLGDARAAVDLLTKDPQSVTLPSVA